jgi:hypothetical protein
MINGTVGMSTSPTNLKKDSMVALSPEIPYPILTSRLAVPINERSSVIEWDHHLDRRLPSDTSARGYRTSIQTVVAAAAIPTAIGDSATSHGISEMIAQSMPTVRGCSENRMFWRQMAAMSKLVRLATTHDAKPTSPCNNRYAAIAIASPSTRPSTSEAPAFVDGGSPDNKPGFSF